MWDYTLAWSCLYNFLKTPGLTILFGAVFDADYYKIIKIYIFSSKILGARLHPASNNSIGGQKLQDMKIITNGDLRDAKMMRRFQIWHHNSNRITFDPIYGQKKLSKIR